MVWVDLNLGSVGLVLLQVDLGCVILVWIGLGLLWVRLGWLNVLGLEGLKLDSAWLVLVCVASG